MTERDIYHQITEALTGSVENGWSALKLDAVYDEDTFRAHAVAKYPNGTEKSFRIPIPNFQIILKASELLRRIIYAKSGKYFDSYTFELNNDGEFKIEFTYKYGSSG